MNDTLAELLADMSAALDERLANMRRGDAIRDAARCTSAEQAADVAHRFAISQVIETDGPAVAVKVLQ